MTMHVRDTEMEIGVTHRAVIVVERGGLQNGLHHRRSGPAHTE